jgi:hypothetical protein
MAGTECTILTLNIFTTSPCTGICRAAAQLIAEEIARRRPHIAALPRSVARIGIRRHRGEAPRRRQPASVAARFTASITLVPTARAMVNLASRRALRC